MSLRARLLIGLVALTTVGLLVADVVTFTQLRGFLYERLDQQVAAARGPAVRALLEGHGPFGGPGRDVRRADGPPNYPAGTYAQVRGPDGTVVAETWLGSDEGGLTRPSLPRRIPTRVFTTDSHRVAAEIASDGSALLVAVPTREARQTLAQLFGVMLVVGMAVLGGMGALAWWIVRSGLRPLEQIEHTAAEIAAGDLSRRVETTDERTEVGRLGLALNAMLAQIEEAFAERRASEERLRRFLADASHELRTPLTSIRGYAELFRRGAGERPADLAKSMQRIEEEADRMGILVEDLLVLARLDQGRPLERSDVDLAAIAADAVADARAVDPDRTIAIDAPGPLIVSADEVRLRQILANLLTNALHHTPAGSPVEVLVAPDGTDAVLSVVDHGPGLPPEDTDRVFERFYRADPSRARETGGVGLGLAIVASIADAHGGTVAYEPTPRGGATFRVRLPRTGSQEEPR